MQEAKLILDLVEDARLRNGWPVLKSAERICQLFGGCSFVIGGGCWYHNDKFVFDPGIAFSVAIDGSVWQEFKWLAQQLAQGQETVYLVSPEGRVEIVDVIPLAVLPLSARSFLGLLDGGESAKDQFFRDNQPGGAFDDFRA